MRLAPVISGVQNWKGKTMRIVRITVFVLSLMLVAGCSGSQIKDTMYRSIYGFRTNDMRRSPAEEATKPDMSYDQYTQQRKELLKKE